MTRVWRVGDPEIHAAVHELLDRAQLLIADGHHRYETAIAYRDEVGGEGDHNYTLMALTGLDDPGLTVFPTHRMLSGIAGDPERQQALGNGLRELFDVTEVPTEELDPLGEEGVGVFGLYDSHHGRGFRLRLKDSAIAALDEQLAGKPEAYRRLDAAILETLVLKGIAGPQRRGHPRQARDRVLEERRRRSGADRERHLRRRLHPPPDPGRPGQGDLRKRRKHAAEVDLLLPEGPHRAGLQPGRVSVATA